MKVLIALGMFVAGLIFVVVKKSADMSAVWLDESIRWGGRDE